MKRLFALIGITTGIFMSAHAQAGYERGYDGSFTAQWEEYYRAQANREPQRALTEQSPHPTGARGRGSGVIRDGLLCGTEAITFPVLLRGDEPLLVCMLWPEIGPPFDTNI